MFTPATIILIGGIITLVLTYIAALVQERESKSDKQDLINNNQSTRNELVKKTEEIAKIQRTNDEEIKGLQQKLISGYKDQVLKSEEIASLYKRLAESQEKVAALSEETKYYLTGGDSYCFIDMSTAKNLDKVYLTLVHVGVYPLQNVEVSLFNSDFACENNQVKKGDDSSDKASNTRVDFKVDNLKAATTVSLGEMPTNIKAQKNFEVRFRANNREWYQRIMLRISKYSNSHMMATHIYKFENSTKIVLKEGTADNLDLLRVMLDDEEKVINIDEESFGENAISGTWKGFPLYKDEVSPWTNRCKVIWDRGLFLITSEKGI